MDRQGRCAPMTATARHSARVGTNQQLDRATDDAAIENAKMEGQVNLAVGYGIRKVLLVE